MDRRRTEKEPEERIEGTRERQGPNPVVIFGAIGVVVVLVIIVAFFAFSGSNLDSISVDNPVEDADGITFGLTTTSGNLGKWSGTVGIEIYYEDQEGPVYTAEEDVTDDTGSHQVDWDQFVWGNGNYQIFAKAEGLEEYAYLNLRRVVTHLDVEWWGNPVDPREQPGHSIQVNISYMFGNTNIPRNEYPSGYEMDSVVSPPMGSDISITSQGSKYRHQERIDHRTAGEYAISGTLTNTFCHPESPYRTISVEDNSTFYFDAPPFAVVTGDTSVELDEGEAVASFDASGSWDDGSIVEYQWDFGDGGTDTTTSPNVQHAYAETGTFAVSVYVIDNEGKGSENQTGLYNIHIITVI